MTGDTSTREKGRAVFLAAIMVVSMFAVGASFAGTAAAQDIETADRTIEDTELTPGDTTEVTVDITVSEEEGPFLLEEFDPAFEDVSIVSADPFTQIGGSNDANDELTAGWDDDGTEYTVTYEVVIPDDAEDGDDFGFQGEVSLAEGDETDTEVEGDDTISIIADDGDEEDENGDEEEENGDEEVDERDADRDFTDVADLQDTLVYSGQSISVGVDNQDLEEGEDAQLRRVPE